MDKKGEYSDSESARNSTSPDNSSIGTRRRVRRSKSVSARPNLQIQAKKIKVASTRSARPNNEKLDLSLQLASPSTLLLEASAGTRIENISPSKQRRILPREGAADTRGKECSLDNIQRLNRRVRRNPIRIEKCTPNPLCRRESVRFGKIHFNAVEIACPDEPWLLADHVMKKMYDAENGDGIISEERPVFVFSLKSLPEGVQAFSPLRQMLEYVFIEQVELVSYNGRDGLYFRKAARELRSIDDGTKRIKRTNAFEFYEKLEDGNRIGGDKLKTETQLRTILEDELANTHLKQNIFVADVEVDGDFGTMQELNCIHNPTDHFLPGFGGNIPKATLFGSYLLGPSVMTTQGFISIHALASESVGSRCWFIYKSDVSPRINPIHVDLNRLLHEGGSDKPGCLEELVGRQFTKQCNKWMESGQVLLHPTLLMKLGIRIEVYVQRPGEFIILPGYTCYSTYDTGKGLVFSALLLPPIEYINNGISNYTDYESKYKYVSECGTGKKIHRGERELPCKHQTPFDMSLDKTRLESFYIANTNRCAVSDIRQKLSYKPLGSISKAEGIIQTRKLSLWVSVPDYNSKRKRDCGVIISNIGEGNYLVQRSNVKTSTHVVNEKWISMSQEERRQECDVLTFDSIPKIAIDLNKIGRVYRRWMPANETFTVYRIQKREINAAPLKNVVSPWEIQDGPIVVDGKCLYDPKRNASDKRVKKKQTIAKNATNKSGTRNKQQEDSVPIGDKISRDVLPLSDIPTMKMDYKAQQTHDNIIDEKDEDNGSSMVVERRTIERDCDENTGDNENDYTISSDTIVDGNANDDNNDNGNVNCNQHDSMSVENEGINDADISEQGDNSIANNSQISPAPGPSRQQLRDTPCNIIRSSSSVDSKIEDVLTKPNAKIKIMTILATSFYVSRKALGESVVTNGAGLLIDFLDQTTPFYEVENFDEAVEAWANKMWKPATSCGHPVGFRQMIDFEEERGKLSNLTTFLKTFQQSKENVVVFNNFSPVCDIDCVYTTAKMHGKIESIYMSGALLDNENNIVQEYTRLQNLHTEQLEITSTPIDTADNSRSGIIIFQERLSALQCNATQYFHFSRPVSFHLYEFCSINSMSERPFLRQMSEKDAVAVISTMKKSTNRQVLMPTRDN